MSAMTSSVSPKGQVTIPLEIRKRLDIKPKDRVIFRLDGDTIRIESAKSALAAAYRSVPALNPPRTWQEIKEIAHEEHALRIAAAGLDEAE
ncbi:MAG: AbrB/MazE/SpoVT family DNA-binding domain-containing protein [Thermomicrobiales bacterium]